MIPEQAVEAAAKCHYEAELGVNWDDVRPSVKRGYLDDARRMLESAAPHMLIHVHHHDIEHHARSFNEGYEAAMAQMEEG